MKTTIIYRADFIAFAKSKPADETYNPFDGGKCALQQFAQSLRPNVVVDAGFSIASVYDDNYTAVESLVFSDRISRNYSGAICGGAHFSASCAVTWGQLVANLEAMGA